MFTLYSLADVKQHLHTSLSTKKIGFVPTMGALHDGHLTLVKQSKQENDLVVCSIYINPTQFNNASDLEKYPRTVEKDAELLAEAGCDFLFLPTNEVMYPNKVRTTLHFGELETVLEGKFRANHFNGVGLVVSKLFHIIKPHKAYFGQKDLQQCLIIKQLVADYSFDIEIIIVPTVRETDGLAMSSRNMRLTPEQRKIAPKIYEALKRAAKMAKEQATIADIKKDFTDFISSYKSFTLEYVELTDITTLQNVEKIEQGKSVAISTAIFMNEVRLIDNIIVEI
jgi:pantoate--beta-alanine ligase